MIEVKEAQKRLLTAFSPVESQTIKIDDSLDRVLARDIHATLDLPHFDNSAMDGFAAISSDIENASKDNPITLQVAADIPAGVITNIRLQAGQSARIMTGAPIPAGADTVVIVEDTDAYGSAVGASVPESAPC